MATVATRLRALHWKGTAEPVPGDEGAVVDEVLCKHDAGLLIALHRGPVVVPVDPGIIA